MTFSREYRLAVFLRVVQFLQGRPAHAPAEFLADLKVLGFNLDERKHILDVLQIGKDEK